MRVSALENNFLTDSADREVGACALSDPQTSLRSDVYNLPCTNGAQRRMCLVGACVYGGMSAVFYFEVIVYTPSQIFGTPSFI